MKKEEEEGRRGREGEGRRGKGKGGIFFYIIHI